MEMIQIKGFISSIGFSDGNRFVIGHWKESPIGEFGDIMWELLMVKNFSGRKRAGCRLCISYLRLDRIQIENLHTSSDGKRTEAKAHNLEIEILGG